LLWIVAFDRQLWFAGHSRQTVVLADFFSIGVVRRESRLV